MTLQELQVTLDLLSKEIQQGINQGGISKELLREVANTAYAQGVEEGKERMLSAMPDEQDIEAAWRYALDGSRGDLMEVIDISDLHDEVVNSSEYNRSSDLSDDDFDSIVEENV
tara:strand:- start:16 stop:357 length:342 start_codon:yes stop_codon:yes gene_type:complete